MSTLVEGTNLGRSKLSSISVLQCFNDDLIHLVHWRTFSFNFPNTSRVAMNPLRPPLLDAALRSCTRAPRSAAYRNLLLRRCPARPQMRWISDGTRPPEPPGTPERSRVVAPKTRIAFGVVFVGALIYSMVCAVSQHRSMYSA